MNSQYHAAPYAVRALEREHARVARAAPVLHVAVDGALGVLCEAPVVGVAEHVAEEADVVDPDGAKHGESVELQTLLELFGQLNPVAVCVIDVEQTHLAPELEDDPDVDACRAQPVGLRL